MTHIQLDFSKTLEFFGEHELKQQQEIVKSIHKTIHEGTGAVSYTHLTLPTTSRV
ncbi:hypothetical protein JMUB7546_26910 [Staphylococcus aureus]